jgi:hypothetical protein
MPIKPENRARYPKDWKQIAAAIRTRAANKCEDCGLGNGWIGYRDADGKFVCVAEFGTPGDWAGHATGYKLFRIVLTVAHLDHTPENCDPANLRAWCQRCHLRYDAEHHAKTARATRRARLGINDMFATERKVSNG